MIEVIKTGLFSSIQDKGRFGFENFGVPISGSMDQFSYAHSNKLLNNKDNDAVLEITMTGPELKFHEKTKICITGADISPKLNNKSIGLNFIHFVEKGDVLSFGKIKYGIRSYIGIKGGFLTTDVMGSRSMCLNVTNSFRIKKGEFLKFKPITEIKKNSYVSEIENFDHFKNFKIKVYKGPEFNKLSENQKNKIFKKEFTISNYNNRMAYQLNEILENKLEPIISSLVMQGTVQLTPSGKLIILMRDNQTCGGYPRILQLSESSINTLSQKYYGNKIMFEII